MEFIKGPGEKMGSKNTKEYEKYEYTQMEMFPVSEDYPAMTPFQDDYFKKSNFLISAKYKSTLMENKLLTLGLANVKKDSNGNLISEMPAGYIRSMIQPEKKNGSFYDQLFETSIRMTSRQFIIQDENGFDIFHLTPRAKYEKQVGVFRIYWEKELEQYIHEVQKNYTTLSLETFMRFSSVYSYRLYELVKSKMYVPKYADRSTVVDGFYKYTMSLAELKLSMGVVDASEDKVQKILVSRISGSDKPDYEKAVDAAKEKTYERWQKFKVSVLEVAIKEINEKTDISISYDTVRSGKGGKVTNVIFEIQKKSIQTSMKERDLSAEEKDVVLDEILDLIEEKITIKDCKAIAEAADYDMDKIQKVYQIAKNSPSKKENLVGYLISGIKNNYEEPVSSKGAENKRSNKFSNFSQRGDAMDPEVKERYNFLWEKKIMEQNLGIKLLTPEEEMEFAVLKEEYNKTK